jgi:hypothetical protein
MRWQVELFFKWIKRICESSLILYQSRSTGERTCPLKSRSVQIRKRYVSLTLGVVMNVALLGFKLQQIGLPLSNLTFYSSRLGLPRGIVGLLEVALAKLALVPIKHPVSQD